MTEENPAERTLYSYDHVHAALCIWEELTDHIDDGPWTAMREDLGANQMRDYVIEILAPAANEAWEATYERYEEADVEWQALRQQHAPDHGQRAEYEEWLADNPPPDDPAPFDWEFVPMWLRHKIDWSGDKPVVKGSTMSEQTS